MTTGRINQVAFVAVLRERDCSFGTGHSSSARSDCRQLLLEKRFLTKLLVCLHLPISSNGNRTRSAFRYGRTPNLAAWARERPSVRVDRRPQRCFTLWHRTSSRLAIPSFWHRLFVQQIRLFCAGKNLPSHVPSKPTSRRYSSPILSSISLVRVFVDSFGRFLPFPHKKCYTRQPCRITLECLDAVLPASAVTPTFRRAPLKIFSNLPPAPFFPVRQTATFHSH